MSGGEEVVLLEGVEVLLMRLLARVVYGRIELGILLMLLLLLLMRRLLRLRLLLLLVGVLIAQISQSVRGGER